MTRLPAPESKAARREPPPPLEANEQLVAAVITAAWAVALCVLLAVRADLAARERWWIWTAVAGVILGLFGLCYLPRVKRRSRNRSRGGHPGSPETTRQARPD